MRNTCDACGDLLEPDGEKKIVVYAQYNFCPNCSDRIQKAINREIEIIKTETNNMREDITIGDLRLGYLAKFREYPEDEEKILVMRGRGNDELAPSSELLEDYKNGDIDFVTYRALFKDELRSSEKSRERIREIARRVVRDREKIRLICFEKRATKCHRLILYDLIYSKIKELVRKKEKGEEI